MLEPAAPRYGIYCGRTVFSHEAFLSWHIKMLEPRGKKINNLIYNTFKRNLGPGAVKTGLVTKASNYRAVKHLPASLWAEKPSAGWESQNGNAVSHCNNVTSLWPHSQS